MTLGHRVQKEREARSDLLSQSCHDGDIMFTADITHKGKDGKIIQTSVGRRMSTFETMFSGKELEGTKNFWRRNL